MLCTQFCDKRDILIGSFEFPIGKTKLKKQFRAIERIRNNVAHANHYAMAFKQAKKLRATLGDLILCCVAKFDRSFGFPSGSNRHM